MALSGTIINALLIIAGTVAGLIFKKILPERLKDTLLQAVGLIVMFVGIGGAVSATLTYENGAFGTKDTLIMILAMVLGTIIGELINIEKQLDRFGAFCQKKLVKENAKSTFAEGMVTASLIFAVGAMAVVGAMEDGINGDMSILIAKSILDLIIIAIMAASMGKGCVFSFVPVGILQGSITLLSRFIAPYLTVSALNNLSFVGSVLIFCVGLNLMWDMKIKVANMLPAVILAMIL